MSVPIITTARLDLVPGTVAHFEADLRADGSLARMMNAAMPAVWPVEHWDDNVLRWCIDKLSKTTEPAWWSARYIVLREGTTRTLIGTCGIKGPPNEKGEVEIGYGVSDTFRRRGIASEAAAGLINWIWQDPRVRVIIGHTLPNRAASQGVLLNNGFIYAGKSTDPDEGEVARYELARK